MSIESIPDLDAEDYEYYDPEPEVTAHILAQTDDSGELLNPNYSPKLERRLKSTRRKIMYTVLAYSASVNKLFRLSFVAKHSFNFMRGVVEARLHWYGDAKVFGVFEGNLTVPEEFVKLSCQIIDITLRPSELFDPHVTTALMVEIMRGDYIRDDPRKMSNSYLNSMLGGNYVSYLTAATIELSPQVVDIYSVYSVADTFWVVLKEMLDRGDGPSASDFVDTVVARLRVSGTKL